MIEWRDIVSPPLHSTQRINNAMYKSTPIALSILLLGQLSACSVLEPMFTVEEVKPWQKGVLAKKEMSLEGDTIDQYVDDHIYFSKEGSTGGASVGGGGCGCN